MESLKKTFSIVEFTVDNTVEVVPSSWVSETQENCKYPSPIPKGFLKVQWNVDSLVDTYSSTDTVSHKLIDNKFIQKCYSEPSFDF